MNCLPLHLIYGYLENELSDSEASSIQEHLARCSQCQQAIEERQKLLQAAESLPQLNTPSDFTQQVISRIFPQTLPLTSALVTAVAGSCVIFLSTLLVFLLTGQNLINVLMAMNQSMLNSIQNISLFVIKLAKLAFLFIKIIIQFAGYLLTGLTHLASALRPEFQMFLVLLVLLISGILFYGLRRKFLLGERQ